LLREAKKINDVSEDKLIEYTDTMVSASLLIGTGLLIQVAEKRRPDAKRFMA
jgi:hypothetical protein